MFENADIIHSYTRLQAIEDGVLVPVPKELWSQLYKYETVISGSISSLIDSSCTDASGNSRDGILWDILYMSQHGITRRIGDFGVEFEVYIFGDGRQRKYTMRCICGPTDNGSPCLTIMMPFED
jgi:uncharacterized protein DUF6573